METRQNAHSEAKASATEAVIRVVPRIATLPADAWNWDDRRAGPSLRDAQARVPGAVIGGLYVADTSTFPTGLGVNPMLTIMALARRTSRTILDEIRAG